MLFLSEAVASVRGIETGLVQIQGDIIDMLVVRMLLT
jgi:hypothetical protein